MNHYTVSSVQAQNNPVVVRTMKQLLNLIPANAQNQLPVDGIANAATMRAALQYSNGHNLGSTNRQINTRTLVHLCKMQGATLFARNAAQMGGLAGAVNVAVMLAQLSPWMMGLFGLPLVNNTKRNFNVEQFLLAYRENFSEYLPRSAAAWEANFRTFCGWVAGDAAINDSRWEAYLFATAVHEGRALADEWKMTWNPVSETNGPNLSYGGPKKVVDWDGTALDATGQRIAAGGNPNGQSITRNFYGRGYVQITHMDNYRSMDEALTQNNLFVTNPDRAISEPNLSYRILSYGLRNGSFRGSNKARVAGQGYVGGHKLADYLNGTTTDYLNARRIVNGDTATNGQTIADYALDFKAMLEATAVR